MNSSINAPKIVIDDSKIKLIPDTKINISQLKAINNVWPKSGCIINKKEINNVNNNEKINLVVKFDKLLLEIIKANIIIKKGFTNSIGCILGRNNKSIHLFEPLTSTPIIGTKINKIKVIKKI